MIPLTREHRLLAGCFALVAGVLWVYDAVVFRPAFRAVIQVGREVGAAGKQLRDIRDALAQEPRLRQEHAQLTQAVEGLRTALPAEEDLPTTIQALSEAASQSGMRVQTMVPQRSLETFGAVPTPPPDKKGSKKGRTPAAAPPPALYRQIPIQIDAVAGFHQLGAFISRMESGPQAIRVAKFRVNSEKAKDLRRHQIKVTVQGYFSVPPTAPPRVAEGS